MFDSSSSTGVHAKMSRWFDWPSNTLMAPPRPNMLLWIRSAILSGSSLAASGQPVRKRHSWSTMFQSSSFGVTVARCTYWKWALSGPFSATIWGCTGSRSASLENSG